MFCFPYTAYPLPVTVWICVFDNFEQLSMLFGFLREILEGWARGCVHVFLVSSWHNFISGPQEVLSRWLHLWSISHSWTWQYWIGHQHSSPAVASLIDSMCCVVHKSRSWWNGISGPCITDTLLYTHSVIQQHHKTLNMPHTYIADNRGIVSKWKQCISNVQIRFPCC